MDLREIPDCRVVMLWREVRVSAAQRQKRARHQTVSDGLSGEQQQSWADGSVRSDDMGRCVDDRC